MIDSPQSSTSQSSVIAPEFGTSAEKFPVARIGDIVLALLPTRDGGFFLASAWRISKPLEELRQDHFYGHDGRVENEAAFRDRAIETCSHMNELSALSRIQTQIAASTPWGGSQFASIYADGVIKHATACHGGFHLTSDRNRQVDLTVRTEGGWYEEDAEWAIVAISFPHLFTAFERRWAERTIKDSWPDAWEAIFGTMLQPGESYEKDRRTFEAAHAAAAPVYDMAQLAADPHLAARQAVVDLDGTPMQGLVARLSATPGRLRWAGRPLGADTDEVRAELDDPA